MLVFQVNNDEILLHHIRMFFCQWYHLTFLDFSSVIKLRFFALSSVRLLGKILITVDRENSAMSLHSSYLSLRGLDEVMFDHF